MREVFGWMSQFICHGFIAQPDFRMVQLGLQDEIMNSKTIWLCASCLTCSVRCPRGVDIAGIFEALRLLVTRDKETLNYVEPSEIPKEKLEELPQIALISNFRKFTG